MIDQEQKRNSSLIQENVNYNNSFMLIIYKTIKASWIKICIFVFYLYKIFKFSNLKMTIDNSDSNMVQSACACIGIYNLK